MPFAHGKRLRTQQGPFEETLTKQSMAEQVDVNNIVARFRQTGLIEHLAKGSPRYLDVSEVGDYRSALEQVQTVGEFFAGLPAPIRAEFGNDPAQLLDAVYDPTQTERLIEIGILTPEGEVPASEPVGEVPTEAAGEGDPASE